MDKQNWQKIEDAFHMVHDLAPKERAAVINDLHRTDPELAREIETLLFETETTQGFQTNPVFTAGLRVLVDRGRENDRLLGSQIGSYKVISLIGVGGMGRVYLAEDERLGRRVALKVLTNADAVFPDAISRFRHEAIAASQISHQNVAHIYEFGSHGDLHFIAMEYVKGSTLRELMTYGPMDGELAIDIASQVAMALSAAHSLGIVHRDIKPENIILTESGLIKVLDFGVAKWHFSPEAGERGPIENHCETTPGMILGTVAYMSPEQVRGHSVDSRSDLWSLGVVFFEMLTGYRPFSGKTPSDIQASILRDETPSLPKSIHAPLFANLVISKCLTKDQLARYQTSTELRVGLEEARESLQAGSVRYRISRFFWSGSNRSKAAVLASVLCTILLATFFGRDLVPWRAQLTQPEASVPSIRAVKSIAVLPFEVNADGESSEVLSYFGEELRDELHVAFGKPNSFSVKTFPVSAFKGITDLAIIRDTLKVDAVLTGTITTRSDRMLEIQIQLVDSATGRAIWEDNISSRSEDLVIVRKELFTRIGNWFRLTDAREVGFGRWSTSKVAAYSLYLSGKYGPLQPDPFLSIRKLEEAIKLDNNFAKAYLSLAKRYYYLYFPSHGASNLYTAESHVQVALELDPNMSGAHLLSAQIKIAKGDWRGAEEAVKAAINLNPNDAEAHYLNGRVFLLARGKFPNAIRELETASDLAPFNGKYLSAIGWAKIYSGDYNGALLACENAVQVDSRESSTFTCLARALSQLGRYREAVQSSQKASEFDGVPGEGMIELALIYSQSEQLKWAMEVESELEQAMKSGNRNVTSYDLACIYSDLGDSEMALKFLAQAQKSPSQKTLFINVDPRLNPLRTNERFQTIAKSFETLDD